MRAQFRRRRSLPPLLRPPDAVERQLRASWTAQELLTTFQEEIGEVALIPGTGGIFEVSIEDKAVWSRKDEGRFPEMKELKQLVRDRIAPEKELGHSDR